jgi:hypothetical protein
MNDNSQNTEEKTVKETIEALEELTSTMSNFSKIQNAAFNDINHQLESKEIEVQKGQTINER